LTDAGRRELLDKSEQCQGNATVKKLQVRQCCILLTTTHTDTHTHRERERERERELGDIE